MKKDMQKQPLVTNLKRRRHRRYDFYYTTYGQIIRKRRLELRKTQEDVAASICSNTYISKAENNQVVMGNDQLNLIMERLEIPEQTFANPEKLVYYLEKIIEYYYFRDIEKYRKLVEKLDGYHFHALVELIKLGFYILEKDYDKARIIYNQLLDYLSSLDDLAFAIFLIFSSDLSLKTNELSLAKFLIDSLFVLHISYTELMPMYLYSRFRIYGRLDLPRESLKAYHQLVDIVIDTGNKQVLNEIVICKAIYNLMYGDDISFKYLDSLIKDLDDDLVDEYLVIKAYSSEKPKYYIDKMRNHESEKYLIALYLLAKDHQEKNNQDAYHDILERIKEVTQVINYDIDFSHLLAFDKEKQWVFYKEYLINSCLKEAKAKENIYMINHVGQRIVEVLESHNRYKDALNYHKQNIKKIERIKYGEQSY